MPFQHNNPEPDDALFGEPYGDLGSRRSPTARLLIAAAVLVPVCCAGWLGWQALTGGDPAGSAVKAAPPSTSSSTPAPQAERTKPAAATSLSADASALGASPSTTARQPHVPGQSLAGQRSLTGRTILLDPGHNPGNSSHTSQINSKVDVGSFRKECDTTGTATNAGYPEASFTLDVVRRARTILQAEGAKVVLTQDGDRAWGPCVDERAERGNQVHADAAVSVHGDGAPGSEYGFHVILPARVVAGKADTASITGPSRALGLRLRDSFAAATDEPVSTYLGHDGIDVRGDLGGLNLSQVPKVFIECGNMRNADDARHMTDPRWRQRAAQGIADGLTAFLAGAGR